MKDELKNLRETEEFITEFKTHQSEQFFKSLAAEYVSEKGEEYLRECEELETSSEIDDFAILRMDAKFKVSLMRENRETKRSKRFVAWGAVAASFVAVCFVAAYWFTEHGFNLGDSSRELMTQNAARPSVAGAVDIIEEADDMYWGMSDAGLWAEADTDSRIMPAPAAAAGAPVGNELEITADEEPAPTEPLAQAEEFLSRFSALASLTAPEGWQILSLSSDVNSHNAILHLESASGSIVNVLAGEPVYDPDHGEFREILIDQTPAYILVENTHSILFFNLHDFQMVLSTEHDYNELIELAKFWM
ncbi:MAG: hypothetical protein FWE27_04080 [Defluviitaleaceae bacterium]|nr:hypothetical protein [Defluviitaleaceae bacterium]